MSGRRPLFLVLTFVGLGAAIGCLQSANFLGAAVWCGATALLAWVAIRSTYPER